MKTTMADCPFCAKFDRNDEDIVWYNDEHHHHRVARLQPLNPVVPGHLLFVPVKHLTWDTYNWISDPAMMAWAIRAAAEYVSQRVQAYGEGVASFNIITSCGAPATQTVPHIHIHVVPREEGDGLTLPWTGQKRG